MHAKDLARLASSSLRVGCACVFALPVACAPAVPAWTDASDLPLTVGDGAYAPFVAHVDGSPLLLHRGFQGGQHIGYALRATGLQADALVDVTIWAVAHADASLLVNPATTRIVMARPDGSLYAGTTLPDDGTVESIANIFFIDEPGIVLDQDVELRVQLVTQDGRIARDAAAGLVQWEPEPEFDDEPLDGGTADAGSADAGSADAGSTDAGRDVDGGSP